MAPPDPVELRCIRRSASTCVDSSSYCELQGDPAARNGTVGAHIIHIEIRAQAYTWTRFHGFGHPAVAKSHLGKSSTSDCDPSGCTSKRWFVGRYLKSMIRPFTISDPPLELEIDGKLELPGGPRLNCPAKRSEWSQKRPVDGIHLGHIRSIQHVEGFDDEIELPVRLDVEVLENPKVQRRRRRQPRRV